MHKKSLRRSFRAQRAALPSWRRRRAAQLIGLRLRTHPLWHRARVVAAYEPVRGEANPSAALGSGITTVYPRLCRGGIKFVAPRSFTRSRLGLTQPLGRVVPLSQIDVFLVPLLAFDRHGNRLGQGGGMYDRVLAQPHRGTRIGVAYALQEVARLNVQPHDVRMHWVVTPRKLRRAAKPAPGARC